MGKVTLSFRVDEEKKDALDELAKMQDRDRTYLIKEAVDNYLSLQAWQTAKINEGIADIESGNTYTETEMDEFFDALRAKCN